MTRFLTSGEVCEVVVIPFQTLDKWVRMGALTPAIESRGTGEQRRFSVAQTFAVLVGRWLKHDRGHAAAGNAMNALLRHSDDGLERSFAEGRTQLLVVNGNVSWRLTSRGAVEENQEVKDLMDAAKAAGIEPTIELIDVEKPWKRLQKWLAKTRAENTKARA